MVPLIFLVGFGVPIAVYLAPLVVAFVRKVPNRGAVAIVNVFVGWTVIGWVVALYMATRPDEPPLVRVPSARSVGEGSGGQGGWYADPSGRHEVRYFDGVGWTRHVSDEGVVASDPIPPSTPE